MSVVFTIVIENASFIAVFLFCLCGIAACYKHSKTLPGADLLLIGFLIYAIYSLLGWAVPGFNGSFITDWSRIGMLSSASFKHFLAYGLRLGLILIIIGIFKVARGLKA